MMEYGRGLVGYIISFISLIFALSACIISIIVMLLILYHLYYHHHQLKREEKIILILSSHIYSFTFALMALLASMNIQTLIGDVYGSNFDSSWCVFQAYFASVSLCGMYYAFFVQALYCLLRIVYSNYRWLQYYWIFVISGPVLFIAASVVLYPILFWNGIIYVSRDYFCLIPFTNIRVVTWGACFSYAVPLAGLLSIHIHITVFLRSQSNNLGNMIKKKQERNVVVIRHIFMNIAILLSGGLSAVVITFIGLFNGMEHPLGQRIGYANLEVSLAIVSVKMVIMTPQLKKLVLARKQQNRVTNFDGRIPMRIPAIVQ